MALISCPECGAQVSDKALACPNCGHPINQPAHKPSTGLSQLKTVSWMAIVIALAIFGVFLLISTCKWQPQ